MDRFRYKERGVVGTWRRDRLQAVREGDGYNEQEEHRGHKLTWIKRR